MKADPRNSQPKTPDYLRLRELWDWFTENVNKIEDVFKDKQFIDALDVRVQELGIDSWEIGPGLKASGNKVLVLSPGGERELLELTSAMIGTAPDPEGWEFYSAKPPKAWEMHFFVRDKKGDKFEVDARGWRYCLYRRSSGYEIIIRAPDLAELPEELQLIAAEILVEGEIGEAARLEHIESIVVVEEFDNELENQSDSILKLRDHFAQLISNID